MNSDAKPQQFAFDPQIFLRHVSQRAGVYQMRDADGVVIYVGKAKNLQKRLASYFRTSALSAKTLALMQAVRDIETTVTASEAEALLLENNLIKTHQPRYNILLRDDKSFPYIKFSAHKFPQISIFRRGGLLKGAQAKNSQIFGPYPSAAVARFAL